MSESWTDEERHDWLGAVTELILERDACRDALVEKNKEIKSLVNAFSRCCDQREAYRKEGYIKNDALADKDDVIEALVTAGEAAITGLANGRYRNWREDLKSGKLEQMMISRGIGRYDPQGIIRAALQMQAAIKEAE